VVDLAPAGVDRGEHRHHEVRRPADQQRHGQAGAADQEAADQAAKLSVRPNPESAMVQLN
jgi:hypothetical protein